MKIRIFLLSVLCVSVLNAGSYYIIKSSKNSVDKTIDKIEKIAKEKGLSVFGVFDHKANAKKAGMNMMDGKVITIGSAKMGTRIMRRDPKAGIELPVRIYVYKDYDDHTKIEYLNPKEFEKRFDLMGCGVVPKMDKVLNEITDKASK